MYLADMAAPDGLRALPDRAPRPALRPRYDVAVVGGGITGAATAYHLASAGAAVVLLERSEVGTEASGRNAGSLHGQIQHEPFARRGETWARAFLPALGFLTRSLERWATLSATLGADLEVTTNGGLLLVDDPAHLPTVEAKVALERECGIDARVLSRAEVRDLAPWVSPRVVGAGFSPIEGKANPMLATAAFARAAAAAGAEISTRTTVSEIEQERDALLVRTTRATLRAERVVLASGNDLGTHTRSLGTPLPVTAEPVQVSATEPVAPLIKHLVYFAGARLTLKQARVGSLLIGGGWPARLHPDTGYPLVDVSSLRQNLAVAVRAVPRIADALLLRSWAGIGNATPDLSPIVGALPGNARVLVGIYPHMGLTAGPLMGEALAALALGLAPPLDLAPFGAERFLDR